METENRNNKKTSDIIQKVQKSSWWKYSRLVTSSATFALLLSIAFFVYETIDSKINNDLLSERLENVNNSLSTRYLGLFPHYIKNTNQMLRDALEKKEDFTTDTIVILEDVLYYGITSDPQGFIEVNDKLFQLADRGAKVFVVYYDTKTALFVKNLREQLFSQKSYKQFVETQALLKKRVAEYQSQRHSLVRTHRNSNVAFNSRQIEDSLVNVYFSDIIDRESFKKYSHDMRDRKMPYDVVAEMILNERYFDSTRCEDPKAFKDMIIKYRTPLISKKSVSNTIKRQSYIETIEMCNRLDSVRALMMEQQFDSIQFEHFIKMFGTFTEIIENEYFYHRNITLIPIEDYLSMSCWMIGNNVEGYHMIIAYPSRYSSSEIGFASQDDNVARYIHTMLEGISTNYPPKKR